MRRLVAHKAARACRYADRAADIGAGGDGRHARSQSGRRPARRTAGAIVEFERIAGYPPDPRIAGAGKTELWRGRAGMEDRSGLFKPFDHWIGMIVDMILVDERALSPALALHPLDILHRDRKPLERARSSAHISGFGPFGRISGLVVIGFRVGIDRRIDLFRPRNQRLEILNRRQPAPAKPGQRFLRRNITEVGLSHHDPLSARVVVIALRISSSISGTLALRGLVAAAGSRDALRASEPIAP